MECGEIRRLFLPFSLSGRKIVGFLHMGYHLFSFYFQKKTVMIKIMKREYG